MTISEEESNLTISEEESNLFCACHLLNCDEGQGQ
jgi:hypothetical protein